MISSEFALKLQSFPHLEKCFAGIYSSDTIPKNIKKNSFIICNTDTAQGRGIHWYCVLKIDPLALECFDSLGIKNEKKEFLKKKFHFRNIDRIKFNTTQVQSSLSDTCGYFVLYFLIHRFHNKDLSFSEILNEIFVSSVEENENKVKDFQNFHFQNE